MVTDLNKKPSSIASFKTTTGHLSPLTYRSNLGDPTEAPAKICEMQYKQIPTKLDSRQQINSAVLNKDGFILQSRPDRDYREVVILKL